MPNVSSLECLECGDVAIERVLWQDGEDVCCPWCGAWYVVQVDDGEVYLSGAEGAA